MILQRWNSIVWPQWWSFEDKCQLGVHFLSKNHFYIFKLFFEITDFHMGLQKVLETDIEVNFQWKKMFSFQNTNLGLRLVTKVWDWAKYHNRHSSKSTRATKLSFCQNDVHMGESFWQKNSLVTLILFELYLLWYLAQSQTLVTSLYYILSKIEIRKFV